MEHLPKRSNLAGETATTLKEWITTGVVRDVLPGELQLKERLGVGRDTLRLALKSLEEEGWVSPSVKGRQRQIQIPASASEAAKAAGLLPVTFLSPHAIEARVTLLEMEDTQMHLAEQGRSLRYIAPDIFHLQHPESRLERLVRENPSAAWILYVVSEPMQRWFDRKGIPTLLYGTPFPGVKLPFVVSDWGAAAYHAGLQLVRQGHRIIGVMEYQDRFPGVLAEERGIEQALATVGNSGRMVLFKDDRTPASIAHSLELAFSLKQRPTALVLTYTSQLLTCYSWLVSKGIRVPADVSIISLTNDSWFNDLHPRVCHYQPETKLMSRKIAQRVLDLVQSGRVLRKSLRIPLEYVPGGTIGAVPEL
ncbi:MAG TPA: substrate-binding domain-containing protein [Verrucomicrobiae bacterium]